MAPEVFDAAVQRGVRADRIGTRVLLAKLRFPRDQTLVGFAWIPAVERLHENAECVPFALQTTRPRAGVRCAEPSAPQHHDGRCSEHRERCGDEPHG